MARYAFGQRSLRPPAPTPPPICRRASLATPWNRLLTVATSVAPAKAFSYDAIGNMLSKSV